MLKITRRCNLLFKVIYCALACLLFLTFNRTGQAKNQDVIQMSTYKKPDSEVLKNQLTPLQYQVTQMCGTEPPFQNPYWDNHEPGIYVDVVSKEPLFSSLDKFDSGSGWPSFTRPISLDKIKTRKDSSHGTQRTEVLSAGAGSHLGHVFDDGPGIDHLRYCINSASLLFIHARDLEKEGYAAYAPLFKDIIPKQTREVAILAGGCFWGVEEIIRKLKGVVKTEVGYTGGSVMSPTYDIVKTGRTMHAEAVRIEFDPAIMTYKELLYWFFRLHDPTTMNQQGNDKGTQYRSAIFYQNDIQKRVAQEVKDEIQKSGQWKQPIVTEITAAHTFYPAEEYHQKYLQKHPNGYTCHFLRTFK